MEKSITKSCIYAAPLMHSRAQGKAGILQEDKNSLVKNSIEQLIKMLEMIIEPVIIYK